jgi:hypothetical protein
MATDITTAHSSRRGLLAAGLAAAAAAAAASVARFTPVSAADGDAVTVGSSNDGTTTTAFTVDAANALAGTSTSAKGIEGISTSGQGVNGESSSSAGVSGVSDTGNGVHGTSTSDRGVYGVSTSGTGVEGSGAVGVKAESAADGYALETSTGRLKFAGVSGVATIPSGGKTVTVTPGVPIGANTLVFLTPEANLGNKDLWYTKPEGGTEVTVHLSGTRSNDTNISYLVIDHA